MDLVIVESPTKARTLGRYLGDDFKILASMGHIIDLPKSKLGVEVEKDFKPLYAVIEGKEEIVKKLTLASKKAKQVLLATDPDREGEAIAAHVKRVVKKESKSKIPNSRFRRITFHEITKKAILEALDKPAKINKDLVMAQQARRILDRLVGYNLSPLLWRKVRKGLSAGRVQSVAVKLIVEREKEIEAFKSKEYWEIGSKLKKKKNDKEEFVAWLFKIKEKTAEVGSKKEAEKIIKDLKKARHLVEKVDQREVSQNPPPPFITSTLQRMAANIFSWSSKKTMREAQRLYENGYITYHRTDSFSLAGSALFAAKNFIVKKYGEKYLPEKPRVFKVRSKLAQEAHEAIRPTSLKRDEKKIEKKVGLRGYNLYKLIKKRFIACQMAAALIDKTTIDVKAEDYLLRATGEMEKFDGWRKVYEKTRKEKEQAGKGKTVIQLPEVTINDTLQLIKVIGEQKFTQPPTRYTESSLIKILEKLGIGRPSTYAPTISTILYRKYVEKTENKFYPTKVGIAVTKFLEKYFDEIMDYQFTAQMEADLDKIAQSQKKWVPVIAEFYQPFEKKVKKVKEKAKRVAIETEKTGKKCPECGQGDEVIRIGRFGKFLSCSRFPECRYTQNYVEKIGFKCPKCKKGEVVVRKTRKGKQFFGCSSYPECEWASWKKPK